MVKVHRSHKLWPFRVRLTKQISHCNSRAFSLREKAPNKNANDETKNILLKKLDKFHHL